MERTEAYRILGITAEIERGKIHAGRRDLNYEAKLDIAIRLNIRNDEKGKAADNHDRILRMLRMEGTRCCRERIILNC